MSPARETATALPHPNVRYARNLFLTAAFISFVLSVSLWFSGNREQGIFVGLWVPSILSLGAMMFGSERRS
ncbi:MAG: hypothetical protein ACYTKC_08660 [Planctomycetota bacterium]|jgi:hypothetical protein